MSKFRQTISKNIHNEVATKLGVSVGTVEEIITSMWDFTIKKISESPHKAIYLRYLGTFYGNEAMGAKIASFSENKEEE